MADYIGSTTGIMKYAKGKRCQRIYYRNREQHCSASSVRVPGQEILSAVKKDCVCHNMKLTTLMDVYNCVCGQGGEEIKLDENVRVKAKACIDTMLTLGNKDIDIQ